MTEAALSSSGLPKAGALRLLTDDRLARAAAGGEERAFTAIFQRYHQELYRYCRALLRDDEEARDAVQNTMLRVLGALPGDRRKIALRPWLYRIAHNEAISLLRQRQPLAEAEAEDQISVSGLDDQIETRERLRDLVNDLSSLPERQRGALVMRELSGMAYAEIAAALETSEAAARQTVYETRTALHEMAEGRQTACSEVREAISAADGRVMRGRKLRAHIRGCLGCQDFRAGIGQRQASLAALAPPLPAAAAAGLLHQILGAGHSGTGGGGGLLSLLGGGSGKALATSAAVKSGAAVIATATVAVGAASLTGAINPPLPGGTAHSQEKIANSTAAPRPKGSLVSSRAATAAGQTRGAKRSAEAARHAARGTSKRAAHFDPVGLAGASGAQAGARPGPAFGQSVAQAHAPPASARGRSNSSSAGPPARAGRD
ncbi:MAG: RNA polymerase sigma factor [Solirubrobacterales bacterium]